MKTTVSSYDFHRAFEQRRPDNFSYQGLNVLFEYFEELEQDTGEQIELDVIGICCEYSEEKPEDIAANYSIDINDADMEDEDYADQCKAIILDYLNDNTTVVGETEDTIIYQIF